jgi:hypothetical protein
MASCCKCDNPVERKDAFDSPEGLVCLKCLPTIARVQSIDPRKLDELKQAVQLELGGLINHTLLEGLLYDFAYALKDGMKVEQGVKEFSFRIQKVCGITVVRDMLNYLEGWESLAQEQQKEVRDKMERLRKLK